MIERVLPKRYKSFIPQSPSILAPSHPQVNPHDASSHSKRSLSHRRL